MAGALGLHEGLDLGRQRQRRGEAIRRDAGHGPHTGRLQGRGDAPLWGPLARGLRGAAADGPEHLDGAGGLIRPGAGEDLVEDGPEGVDVHPVIDVSEAARRLLGRHIGRGADHVAVAGQLPVAGLAERLVVIGGDPGIRGADLLRQAPVGEHHLPELAEDDVGGLDVPVDDALLVGVGHAVTDLREPRQHLRCGRPLGADVGPQREPAEQAHDQAGGAVEAAHVVHRHDVGVAQAAGEVGLPHKAGALAGAILKLRPEHLHRDGAAQEPIAGSVDDADGPAANLGLDVIAVAEIPQLHGCPARPPSANGGRVAVGFTGPEWACQPGRGDQTSGR